ncbi:zinc finger, C2H2 type [Teladorsagia circumcincta]|uniref:Zinc finger, C2H2 type n=1 Tax=Teladorsagia circumcincta TaxID=45464 RepID=A0A2G9U229_TELCI|nr:zinc finger, C2H2 type [Teladorsagia circumcincta]
MEPRQLRLSSDGAQSSVSNNSTDETSLQQRRVRRCRICKRFMDYEVLIVHMQKFHGIEMAREVSTVVRPKKRTTRCEVEGCDFIARSQLAYIKHMKVVHSPEEKLEHYVRCPLCQVPFDEHENLVEHCRTDHGDEQCVVEMRTFQNAKECEEFIYEDGAILVKFCTRHMNHDLSVPDLPLSKADRDVIAGYLRRGVGVDIIRDIIRQKNPNPKTRLHWIRNDDIRITSATLQYEEKLKERIASSSSSEVRGLRQTKLDPAEGDTSISAATLLEESFKCEDDQIGRSDDVRPMNSAISAESLLGCSSCIKLAEKVAELEAMVRKLSEQMMEVNGAHDQLFESAVKVEKS